MRRTFAGIVATAAAFVAIGASTRDAKARIISVDTNNMAFANDRHCGLSEALVAVNTQAGFDGCPAGDGRTDTIKLQANTTYTAFAGAPLSVSRSVIVQGVGGVAGVSPVNGPQTRISAANLTSTDQALFLVSDTHGPMTVTFQDLTLLGPNGAAVTGIQVNNTAATNLINANGVTLWIFTNGGINFNGGGNLSVRNSLFFSNSTQGAGGGIFFSGTSKSLTVSQSTFWLNSANSGFGGAIEWLGLGPSSITNSTVAFNSAAFGGGLDIEGGDPGTATSTFGINESTIVSNGCTNFGNSGDCGGGISEFSGPWVNNYTMSGSILAYNHDPDVNMPDYPSDLTSDGIMKVSNSIIYQFGSNGNPAPGAPPIFFVDGGGNQNYFDPGLDATAQPFSDGGSYGLPVILFSPVCLPNCRGIDFVSSLSPPTDERGFLRGVSRDGQTHAKQFDIGAVEYDPNTQAETLVVMASSRALTPITNNPGYSNQAGVQLKAGGAGESASFYIPSPYGGDLAVQARFETGPTMGQVQLAWSNDPTFTTGVTNLGGIANLYASKSGFQVVSFGTISGVDIATYYRFTVTGKDSRSSNYYVNFDWINTK